MDKIAAESLGGPSLVPLRGNPFPGLRSFDSEEDHLFFGRESQVEELLSRLRETRFLTVVGSSGSGKSSLVRSGMIPCLVSGDLAPAGSGWRIAILRPGDDPIGNLAASLSAPVVLSGGGAPAPRSPRGSSRDCSTMSATIPTSCRSCSTP